MASSLGPTGLTIDSINTLVINLSAILRNIYGYDINLNSNAPDGQLVRIFCQAVEDVLELLQSVYNSFGYMQAYGVQLDQRLALLGLARKQGSQTTTPVTIIVNQALILYGLNSAPQTPFTLIDQTGNQWQLVAQHSFSSAGSASLTFQAVTIGPIGVTANTITQQLTTVLGVTAVNNPTTSGSIIGVSEETDTQFKVRAAQSFALASTGPSDSIRAALLNSADITDASVLENDTGSTDGNGILAHSIWVIVAGGTYPGIAGAIYAKKMPGCGMKGSNSYIITRPNGTTFTALWDSALSQALYIKFGILWRGVVALSNATIAINLAAALTYKLAASPSIGDIVTAMLTIAPSAIVLFASNQGVSSDGISYGSVISPTTPQYYYTVSSASIVIT